MYIGIGTVVLIVIIVLVVLMLRRRLCPGRLVVNRRVQSRAACTAAPGRGPTGLRAGEPALACGI